MANRSTPLTVVEDEKPETRDPFAFPLAEKSVSYKGVTYKFRELTVAENDQCRELASANGDDKYDGRLHMRMMIVLGSVEPRIDMDDLTKFPQRLYAKIVEVVSDLNDEGTLEGDEENAGNS